jgi:thiol-disulfide isomerase/thioredoxin
MKQILFFFSLFLIYICKSEVEYNSLILNENNWSRYINNELILVLFHNPWCQYSQKIEKKLVSINKLLKTETNQKLTGIIDVTTTNINNIENFPLKNFTFYPTLALFQKGVFIETYKGILSKDDIYNYLKTKRNNLINLSIPEIFEDKVINDKNAFILYKNENIDIFDKVYETISDENKDLIFYYSNNEKVINKYNKNKKLSLVYYTYGQEKNRMILSKETTKEDILSFITSCTFINYYDRFNETVINEIFIKKQPAIILFRNIYDNRTEDFEKEFPKIAAQMPELKFIVTDLTGKYELKLAKLMRISNNVLPTLRIIDFKNEFRRYESSKNVTVENMKEFIEMWKENKLSPYYSSQIKADSSEKKNEIVRKISASEYYDNVLYNRRNVLVFFQTSWCSHCKKVNNI